MKRFKGRHRRLLVYMTVSTTVLFVVSPGIALADEIVNPPDATVTVDPTLDATVVDPVADVTVVDPAPDATVVDPAPDATVVDPAPDATVVDPAPDATVVDPAPDATVVDPAPDATVVDPAPDATVVDPAPDATVVDPVPDATVTVDPAPRPVSDPIADQISPVVDEPVVDPVSEPASGPTPETALDPFPEVVSDPITDVVTDPISDVVTGPAPETATEPFPEVVSDPITDVVTDPISDVVTGPAPETATEPFPEVVTDPITDVVTDPITDVVTDPLPELVTDPLPDVVTDPLPELVTDPLPELVTDPLPELVTDPLPELVTDPLPELVTDPLPELVSEPIPAPIATSPEPVTPTTVDEAPMTVTATTELFSTDDGVATRITSEDLPQKLQDDPFNSPQHQGVALSSTAIVLMSSLATTPSKAGSVQVDSPAGCSGFGSAPCGVRNSPNDPGSFVQSIAELLRQLALTGSGALDLLKLALVLAIVGAFAIWGTRRRPIGSVIEPKRTLRSGDLLHRHHKAVTNGNDRPGEWITVPHPIVRQRPTWRVRLASPRLEAPMSGASAAHRLGGSSFVADSMARVSICPTTTDRKASELLLAHRGNGR
jgi:hypothetical protein